MNADDAVSYSFGHLATESLKRFGRNRNSLQHIPPKPKPYRTEFTPRFGAETKIQFDAETESWFDAETETWINAETETLFDAETETWFVAEAKTRFDAETEIRSTSMWRVR